MTATAAVLDLTPIARPRGWYRIVLGILWLGMASCGIVFAEPAPVDFALILLIGLVPALGLMTFSRPLLVYAALWLLVVAGGCIGSISAFDFGVAAKQVFVTFYLSMASVVLAGFVQRDPVRHVHIIMNAYLLAALVATLAALVGYFGLVPQLTDLLTEFGRARGTFKDPNVYGAFVVPALVYSLYLGFTGRGTTATLALAATGILLLGALLSFSRGAWSNALVSVALFTALSFATSQSNRFRLRVAGLAIAAGVCGAIVLGLAIQSDTVTGLLSERAQVEQSYDASPNGRFAGHEKAKALIAGHPMGIGPLQFSGHYHLEDVHEVYLNVLLGHGWLGGGAYIIVVALTLVVGLAAALRRSPAQGLLLASLSAYVGMVGEGFIVDTDHWRHFFLMMAIIWGLYLASRQPRQRSGPAPRLRRRTINIAISAV